jgi:hypothetical protein
MTDQHLTTRGRRGLSNSDMRMYHQLRARELALAHLAGWRAVATVAQHDLSMFAKLLV